MLDVILKRFDTPDETRVFEKGKFEIVRIGGITVGRASYEPGWKWSEHVGKPLGQTHCQVEHVGMVVSGCATAAMADGTVYAVALGGSTAKRTQAANQAAQGNAGSGAAVTSSVTTITVEAQASHQPSFIIL